MPLLADLPEELQRAYLPKVGPARQQGITTAEEAALKHPLGLGAWEDDAA